MQFNPTGKGKFSQATAKPKNTKKALKRLGGYLLNYKYLLIIAITLSILSNLFSLIGPKLSGDVLDILALGKDGIDMPKIYIYCMIMAVFYVFSSLFSFILARLMIHISQKIVKKMRKDVFDKLVNLPISYFDKVQPGDIISCISYDIDTINTSLSNDLVNIAKSIITFVGAIAMMIFVSGLLSLVFLITIPLAYFLTKLITSKSKPLFRKRSRSLGNLNGYIEEMITGMKTIKAYNNEEDVLAKFDDLNYDAVKTSYEAERYASCMGPTMTFVYNISTALISCFGAILYLYNHISIGKIGSFIQYSKKATGPINEMANVVSELQSSLAAFERVMNIIDESPESADILDAYNLDNVSGNVKLENVSFSYVPGKKIIEDLSFEAKQGQLIAIVGPTGAGKTTIINLLMRFYDIDSGKILIDNKKIDEIKRSSLRKSYTMVLQDSWLFNGTVRENLKYGNKDATDEEMIKAAKEAKIHDFIMLLDNGYDTKLKENGINISKGQKQLLTIARAMLINSKMLILDEATSNVDTKTELQIQEAMVSLMENKTCFVIAHRLSTIKNADLILVVNNGNIIEQGNHDQLIESKGFYYSLYNAQFK